MNVRFKAVFSYLAAAMREDLEISSCANFKDRHAEPIAASGFGSPNVHTYLNSPKQYPEQCRGYYRPDIAGIKACAKALGYPENLGDKFIHLFRQAVTNSGDFARADLYDDVQIVSQRPSESDDMGDKGMMRQWLEEDLKSDRSKLWEVLAEYGVPNDGEADEHLACSIHLPRGFPGEDYLQREVDVPFTVSYDLDQGDVLDARFPGQQRQLAFRGNLRLKPSGQRGWAFPTTRLEDAPFIDDRTLAERRGNGQRFRVVELDEQQFNDGQDAGRDGNMPPGEASFSFLAGWIMDANGVNASGYMSTGQIEKAFYGALENAKSLNIPDPLNLAAEACRYLASTRVRRALEEMISEEAAAGPDR